MTNIKIENKKDDESKPFKYDVRPLEGDNLVQEKPDYRKKLDLNKVECVTENEITEDRLKALMTMAEVVRKINSNGIIIGDAEIEDNKVKRFWSYGTGSEMRRSLAVKVATMIANEDYNRTKGALCASDGFFPYEDSIDILAEAEIEAIFVPHGGIREENVIAAANNYDIPMYMFEGRLFSHS